MTIYRQTSNIRRTLLGDKIVDHLDVVEASLVDAAPTSFLHWHIIIRQPHFWKLGLNESYHVTLLGHRRAHWWLSILKRLVLCFHGNEQLSYIWWQYDVVQNGRRKLTQCSCTSRVENKQTSIRINQAGDSHQGSSWLWYQATRNEAML